MKSKVNEMVAGTRKKVKSSISRKMVLYISTIFTISIIAIMSVVYLVTKEIITDNIDQDINKTVQIYQLTMSEFFSDAKIELEQDVNSYFNNEEKFLSEIKSKNSEEHNSLENVFFISDSGFMYGEQIRYKETKWFKELNEGRTDTIVSNAYEVGEDKVGIVVAKRIEGGYMGATVNLESLLEMSLEMKIADTGHGFVLDDEGNYIIHPSRTITDNIGTVDNGEVAALLPPLLKADEKVFMFNPDGVNNQLYASSKIPETNFIAVLYAPEKEYFATLKTLTIGIVILSVVIIAIISLIVRRVMNSTVKDISILSDVSTQVASGNLDIEPIETKSSDEIGTLCTNFNNMVASLKGLITTIDDNANYTNSSIASFTAAVENSSNGTEESANNVNVISMNAQSSVNDISNLQNMLRDLDENLKFISSKSEALNNNNNLSNRHLDEGTTSINNVSTAMDNIVEKVKIIAQSVNLLTISLGDTKKIIDDIGLIAKETNLLSLNAQIESARAGESGNGFGVIANQVKQLAENTRASSEEANIILVNNLEELNRLLENVEESETSVIDGKDLMDKTREKFYEIKNTVEVSIKDTNLIIEKIEESNETSTNIYENSEVVNGSMNEVSDNVLSMSAVLEEQTASMEELTAISHDLLRKSNEMKEQTEQFKI